MLLLFLYSYNGLLSGIYHIKLKTIKCNMLVMFISIGIENYLNGAVMPLFEKRYLKITTLKFRSVLIFKDLRPHNYNRIHRYYKRKGILNPEKPGQNL